MPGTQTINGYTNCQGGPAGQYNGINGAYNVTNAEGPQSASTQSLYTGTTQSVNVFYAQMEKRVGLCNVSGDFVARGEIVSTRARHAEDSEWLSAKGMDILDGAPLVVLINGGSASVDRRGSVAGSSPCGACGTRSFGKGSVQTVIPLPDNGAIRLTTARYYTPSGRSIQGLGIGLTYWSRRPARRCRSFDPEHEANLNHVLKNRAGTPEP